MNGLFRDSDLTLSGWMVKHGATGHEVAANVLRSYPEVDPPRVFTPTQRRAV
jgi:hypothetical protein